MARRNSDRGPIGEVGHGAAHADDVEHLLDDYSIPRGENEQLDLILALARKIDELVADAARPKKRITFKSGALKKWTPVAHAVLVVDFQQELQTTPSEVAVSAVLATREPWTSFVVGRHGNPDPDDQADALRREYQRAKRQLAKADVSGHELHELVESFHQFLVALGPAVWQRRAGAVLRSEALIAQTSREVIRAKNDGAPSPALKQKVGAFMLEWGDAKAKS